MFRAQVTPTMELLSVACVCLLMTSAAASGVSRLIVKEDSDVVLPCSFDPTDITAELFDWKRDGNKEVFLYDKGDLYGNGRPGQDEQYKGRVFHFQDELKSGNASIVIRKAKVTDNGSYTCDFPRRQPMRRSQIELVVGASPFPSVTNLDQTPTWALLRCVVRRASPKPDVKWQDSNGHTLPAEELITYEENYSYVTLNTTVSKTGRYTCVSTQDAIHHQISDHIYVRLEGAATEPYITTLKQTKDWARLQCVIRGASPKPRVEWRDSSGNKLPAAEPQVTERGGRYDVILQTTVTKTDNYSCVIIQETIKHEVHAETSIYINGAPGPPSGLLLLQVLGLVSVMLLL